MWNTTSHIYLEHRTWEWKAFVSSSTGSRLAVFSSVWLSTLVSCTETFLSTLLLLVIAKLHQNPFNFYFLKIIFSKLIVLFLAAMELPGTLIVLVLISRVSRLKILIGGSIVCSMSLLLLIVVTDPIGQVCLASLSLAAMVIIFPTIYLYSTEVFPTVVRNIGVGTGSICARVGSMIAPFIATMVKSFFTFNLLFKW